MTGETLSARFPVELSVWFTASFPVGSFAFSHGLEWAVGSGRIASRATATHWICDVLQQAGPRNDVILLAAAWNAVREADWIRLAAANDLALSLSGSRERYLETSAQGNAFMTAILAAWSTRQVVEARATISGDVAFPVAAGIASCAHGLPLGPTVRAYLASLVVNMTSALVRLSVIGQTDAQRIICDAMPGIENVALQAEGASLDDIWSAAFVSDIGAIAHETQDTRLFRT